MNIGQGVYPILGPDQANPVMNGFARALAAHLQMQQAQQNRAQMPFVAPQAKANLMQTQLGNQRNQATLPYAAPQAAANLGQTNASTQDAIQRAIAQQITNKTLPQQQQQSLLASSLANQLSQAKLPYAGQQAAADLGLTDAQAQYYKSGGSAGQRNANQQLLTQAQDQVALDNPQFANDPSKVRAALNAVMTGQSTLPDGTKINPPSAVTLNKIGALAKNPSTAKLVTDMVKANQAEAEVDPLSKRIKQYTSPYGDTLAGKSPQQIADSFSSDTESQQRLGDFIAGQALQYELAQIRIKLAGGEPSATATKELMDMSGQRISADFPKLSATARNRAMDSINNSLGEAFDARKKVGINAAQTIPQESNASVSSAPIAKPSDDEEKIIADQMKRYPKLTRQQIIDALSEQ